ncbi:MAG TPA: glycosyltransferase family 2 protein [Acidimicrobiales bacterium]|nr:glycosyltransferase family 2 protein [Acidimicrobiales bacterium]
MHPVDGVVVTHGTNDDLTSCITSVSRDVRSLVIVDNLPPTPLPDVPNGVVVTNPQPRSFAENVNLAVARTEAPYVAVVNPDCVPDPGAISRLCAFLDDHPRAGIVAPQLRWPDGRRQPTGRSFPTVGATLVRRTPLRLLFPPFDLQRRHYRLGDQADPWPADWLLGAFWVVRRRAFDEVGGMDERYPMYVEDIDLCARLRAAGHERWVLPEAGAVHEYQAVIDRRFLSRRNVWHLRGMARFARKHPALLVRPDRAA